MISFAQAHLCDTQFATYRAIIVQYFIKTSTEEFCDTIARSIARYEKYRCWVSKVLGAIDELFDRPSPAFCPDVFPPDRFNAGVIVLEPSADLFQANLLDGQSTPRHQTNSSTPRCGSGPNWKRGKDPHPQDFNLTKKTARFTKDQFCPY